MKWFVWLILVLIVIVGVSAFLVVQNLDGNSNIDGNSSNNHLLSNSNIDSSLDKGIVFTNHTGLSDKNNVIVTANCQKTAYQGTNASIIWKVTNNGNKTIENAVASNQVAEHNFGNIKPGETKIYQFSSYIPTNKDLEMDFGRRDDQWPGSLWWGGFGLSYFINEKEFSSHANSMEINVKV